MYIYILPESSAAAKHQEESSSPSERDRSKSDSRAEARKLFEQLRAAGRPTITTVTPHTKKISAPPLPHKKKAAFSRSAVVVKDFHKRVTGMLREMGGGRTLLEFCSSLPVFKTFSDDKENFFAIHVSADPTSELRKFISRSVSLCVCVCVCVCVCCG